MKIKKVAVLGAGAVGSYVIWGLSQKDNIQLGVIAEGERAERLKEGITINSEKYYPNVWSSTEKNIDLLIVALKYNSLQNAVKTIASAVNENTVVMSLMNGVDSEEIISAEIGKKNVIHSFIKVASHKENNGYCFNPETTLGIIFGET